MPFPYILPLALAANPVVIAPGAATVTITGSAPAIVEPVLVTPGGATVTITGSAPTITAATQVTPTPATVTITGSQPGIIAPTLLSPGGVTVTITGSAPNIPQSGSISPGPARITLTTYSPSVSGPAPPTTGEGGIPAWAASVSAFSAASQRSGAVTTTQQLQFPDTSQLGGLCGNALGGSAFTSGLVANGDPTTQGAGGALISGTQGFADGLCSLMGGAGAGTTPQSVMSGANDVNDAVNGSPMAAGTIALGQPDGPSGNSALDAINGVQNLANTLYNIFNACGCGQANSPANVSPQQVIDTTQETADGVSSNPMASGILSMGQEDGGTGNIALDAINGAQAFANSLYSIMQLCGCSADNAPANVTPQQVIDTSNQTANAVSDSPMATGIIQLGQTNGGSGNVAVDAINGGNMFAQSLYNILQLCGCGGTSSPQQATPQNVINTAQDTADAVSSSPMASGILAMGQTDGGSGNVAIDGINGTQNFANSLFNILQICGCGVQQSHQIGFVGPHQDSLNPYAPANVTPDIILSAAQQVADAVAANPLASNVIASGLPGSSGNLGVAVVSGVTAAATAFQNDVSAASTLGQANTQAISLQAINNANYHAIDKSLNAVFNISSLTGTSPDTVTVTEDASVIGFITIPTSTTKTFGVFIGHKTGTITSAVINVYRVDSASQVLTLVSTSQDVATDLTTNLLWIYGELLTDIPVDQGQEYAVELAVAGSGSLTIVGMPNHWLPQNPNVYPSQLAAMRSTDVFDSSVAWAGTGTVTTGSWTHIIGALASAVFVTVNAVGGGGSPTASVGGHAMTLLEDYGYSGGHLYVWVLYNPPTDSQNVSFTGLTSSLVSAGSVAFNGVTAAGTPVTASGTGTSLSQNATGTSGGLLFQAFGYSAGTGTITGYNQNLAVYEPGSSGNCDPLVVGYVAATGSSQTFTATGSPSDPWGAVAIPLTATIPTITAPSTMTAPTYSPNVPWLALSSVLPPPLVLTPATATQTLTAGRPVVTYPGSPSLFVLVDSSSATTHTVSTAYGAFEYTGASAAAWTLPPIAGNNGVLLFFYNRGTAVLTLTCAGADQFYRPSGTTVTLNPSTSMTLTNDGVYWLSV